MWLLPCLRCGKPSFTDELAGESPVPFATRWVSMTHTAANHQGEIAMFRFLLSPLCFPTQYFNKDRFTESAVFLRLRPLSEDRGAAFTLHTGTLNIKNRSVIFKLNNFHASVSSVNIL